MTHSGAGGGDYDLTDPCASLLFMIESHWFSRRALPQLIFGGAFERFPELKIVFTESRVEWAPETIRHLDSAQQNPVKAHVSSRIARKPSEYWSQSCFLSGSFLAPYEVALHGYIGLGNLLWGTDYPHFEGTWPNTRLALRNTFWNVPEDETRQILGGNAPMAFPHSIMESPRSSAATAASPWRL
jgi:predicted TIM-barrel fold metal-dependent hydrolase